MTLLLQAVSAVFSFAAIHWEVLTDVSGCNWDSLGSLAWPRVSQLLVSPVAKYGSSVVKRCCGVGSAKDVPVCHDRL